MTNVILKRISEYLLVVAVVVLIFLAIFTHYHNVLRLDIFLSRDLQAEGDTAARQTLLYHFLYYVSLFGRPVIAAIMVSVVALVFWRLKYFREVVYTLCTPIAAGLNFIVKIIVNRPRPSETFVKVLDRELDPSFPSGHVVFYTVFFGFLIAAMFFTPKIPLWSRVIVGIISGALIVLVSFSRVYLGVHWASDVAGGYALGFIFLFILLYFYLKPKAPPS